MNAPAAAPLRAGWWRLSVKAFALEAIMLAVLLVAYRWGRHLISGQTATAQDNADAVWRFERAIRLPDEQALQQWALSFDYVAKLSNLYYTTVHFPATVVLLVWLFVWHRHAYPRVRNELIALTAMGLVIHILYPLAPPRLASDLSMIDTMNVVGPSAYPAGHVGIANQFAAMPSLHIGWAIVVALAVARVCTGPVRWLVWLHPIITTCVVVVTANHYWLDGIVAAVLLGIAVVAVRIPQILDRRATARDALLPVEATERY